MSDHPAGTGSGELDPEVSVIMPVRNEVAAIGDAVAAVLEQRFDGSFEVIVADGMSDDGTREQLQRLADAHPQLHLVDNPGRRTPHGLNAALARARGRYLVRVDGHSRVQPDFLQRLVGHLRAGRAEAAGGIIHAVGASPFGRAVALANDSPFGVGNAKHHYAAEPSYVDHVPFPAYVTERVRALGGWDEYFIRNQDFEFDYRYAQAGGRILLDPAVVSDWQIRESVRGLAAQYRQYGFWRARSLAKHPRSLRPRWLAPPLLVVTLVAGACLSPWLAGRILLAGSVGSYLCFVALAAERLARSGDAGRVQLAVALATMQLAWGGGFLAGLPGGLAGTLRARRAAVAKSGEGLPA
jgi:succinoglycan biosynthesis protein ExoA